MQRETPSGAPHCRCGPTRRHARSRPVSIARLTVDGQGRVPRIKTEQFRFEPNRMACHPHDPGMPEPQGFRGLHRVLGSVDGLKKFIAISPSPYHGLNFCQGTVSEMLPDPGKQIYDVIRYFGTRKKIFNVHFRNIHGDF